MVSYGPDVQSLNYTHMYSFTDYRDTVGRQPCATNGTVFHYIVNHGEMKKFKSYHNQSPFFESAIKSKHNKSC